MTKQLIKTKGDQNSLEHNWYLSFLSQHSEFKTQYSCNLNQNWKNAENIKFIQKWFDLYNSTQIQHGILKLNIYNMNEKGFAMSITDSFKVLVQCTERQAFSVQADNQNWVSLIECVCFNNNVLFPHFIFKGKGIQQAWLNSIKDDKTVLSVSENSWTINELELQWLKAFDLHTTAQTWETYQLLVLNDHESHVSSDFIQYCCDHSIIALCLLPYSTHLLQSLNVKVFSSLTKAYKKLVYEHFHYNAVNVSKVNFLHYYQKARSTAITTRNVLSAWWAAELVSYDSSIITSNLSQSTTSFFAFFTNFNEVQINITVTPHTATQINQFVNEVLADMTLLLHSHILGLKNTALTAVTNKAVLQQTNQKLLEKQQQQWKKKSWKGVENA